ncbi:transcription antiterminator BglG [Niallia circulans]|uniref:Transcription antiterminator BglG n=1 Tax=Niallia circulans TaxID=1397 RepID=A0A0J1I7X0_NIACI|nr:BglG family transcription antiterminator [Niallia circulans]KLV22058.1 transcription antiterminator BglG [Niallia circulans]MED5099752.1 BglG family transcription antiterminator [Niallia circulans]PAD23296.1 transcription antiterminator BglG [Niallia circulans]
MKERTKQVLKRLLTANTYLTLEDLSNEYHISQRTLRNELMLINEFLQSNNYSLVTTKRGKGMQLTLAHRDAKTLLERMNAEGTKEYYHPDERFLVLLLDIADTSKTTLLYEMEGRLQVSKSTVDEDMRKIRQHLKKYGIQVVSLPKQGVVLQGDERSIRSMLFDVINNRTDFDYITLSSRMPKEINFEARLVLNFLERERIKIIAQLYNQQLKQLNPDVNPLYHNQVILFLAIWIRRIHDGNTISDTVKGKRELTEGQIRDFIDQICERFKLYPSLSEMKYIAFTIESFDSKDMSNSLDWVTAQLLTIQLIIHVEKVTLIPFSLEEEDLYEGLYKHITGLLSRARNDIKVFNPLKETIKESYSWIYQAVAGFSNHIESYIKKPLSEDEIGFLTIYFSTSTSRMKQEEQYIYQAVVVCNHGISTGRLLAANLKEQFNIEIVTVLSSYELSFIDKLDVDIIFSTIPIDYSKKPSLLLNPILRESDKKEIDAFLEQNKEKRRLVSNERDATKMLQDILTLMEACGAKITAESYLNLVDTFKQHRLKFNTREIQPMLQDILRDKNIILHQECEDWKEVIERVSLPLVTEQVIEARYIEAMIHSVEEYGPYIVIGKHLALAHARPEDGVNELGISVMTLKEPIMFGNEENDPVKIIFCLAAVDSYSHLNIMKSLVDLINDKQKVERLIHADNLAIFKQELFEKNSCNKN